MLGSVKSSAELLSGSRLTNVRGDSPDEYQRIVRCATSAHHEVFSLAEQPTISATIMYIPELFFRFKWLKVYVLDELAVGTMNGGRCCLNHVWLAILQNDRLLL
jgi:hypothetical protein